MGRQLVALIGAAGDLRLVSALERQGHPDLGAVIADDVRLTGDPDAAVSPADVLLDFSLPGPVCEHVEVAAALGKPVVTGTTGFAPEQIDTLKAAAGRVALVVASNMSRGVYVLTKLTRLAAELLAAYDAEIFEIHHRNKADAPSGTALQLAGVVEAALDRERVYGRGGPRREREVGVAAARGGDVVGEHQVMFLGQGEQIVLTHRATSREHFCQGALAAVRFVHGRAAGLYDMQDVFSGGAR
jgi:4-hydroxy-tetrahydrodipicolinate reductase